MLKKIGIDDRSISENFKNNFKSKIGIYNETDRLSKAVIWGPLGIEAILAQIYPKDISLFYQDMNVLKAREEAYKFADKLKELGVEIISVRNTLAQILPLSKKPLEKEAVIEEILLKVKTIIKKYYQESKKTLENKINTEAQVKKLIEKDIELYGQQKALNLNKVLCLDTKYPLGNSIYARDQMNILLNTRFISNMKYPIRKPEVTLYEKAYKTILSKEIKSAAIPEGETFEGGDAYIHNNIIYIGVGPRTSKGAAEFIYKILKPQLDQYKLQFAIVEEEHPETRSNKDNMDFMHLDTFSGPIGDKQITVCKEEAEKRKVKFLETGNSSEVVTIDTGNNFLQHLQKQDDLVVVIPREEQQEFGCNFLALDENTLLLPLESNRVTNSRLQAAGKKLIFLGLKESTRGYGASHCMTGQLLRVR